MSPDLLPFQPLSRREMLLRTACGFGAFAFATHEGFQQEDVLFARRLKIHYGLLHARAQKAGVVAVVFGRSRNLSMSAGAAGTHLDLRDDFSIHMQPRKRSRTEQNAMLALGHVHSRCRPQQK